MISYDDSVFPGDGPALGRKTQWPASSKGFGQNRTDLAGKGVFHCESLDGVMCVPLASCSLMRLFRVVTNRAYNLTIRVMWGRQTK